MRGDGQKSKERAIENQATNKIISNWKENVSFDEPIMNDGLDFISPFSW